MGKFSKTLALILTLIVAISCLTLLSVKPASAQTPTPFPESIPIPSIPEFTVNSTNPNIINITIKNQPFLTPINGNSSDLYYNVRFKSHFGVNWIEQSFYSGSSPGTLLAQSNSSNTVLIFETNYQPGEKVDVQIDAILGYQYIYSIDY